MNDPYSNIEVFKYDLFNTAIADILRAIDGGSYIGAFTLGFCCIDYMGIPLSRDGNNTKEHFKQFIFEYMSQIDSNYKNRTEQLWALRNNLIHSYGTSNSALNLNLNVSFTRNKSIQHLGLLEKPDINNLTLSLNLEDFIADIVTAVEYYFRNIKELNESFTLWQERMIRVLSFKEHLFRTHIASGNKFNYSKCHSSLAILDSDPISSIEDVKEFIKMNIVSKYGG